MQDFILNETNPYYTVLLRIARSTSMEGNMKDIDFTKSDVEILLFYALRGSKPVGLFRHQKMLLIHKKFTKLLKKEIKSEVIWNHLESSLYDVAALHESEIMSAIPAENVEFDFSMESSESAEDKSESKSEPADEKNDKQKNESSIKNVKKTSASKSKQNGSVTVSSKNTFATPTSNKLKQVNKNANSVDNNMKKPDPSFASKFNKVKRSSSPSISKNSTADAVSKDESLESPPPKKMKSEANTPASSKKVVKAESSNSTKKLAKQEQTVKQSKADTLETPSRKAKSDKESVHKKGKTSNTPDSSSNKRNSNVESKKSDLETLKRSSDSAGKAKTDRASSVSSRGSRQEDSDSSAASGSRKSSASGKSDPNDKKKKKNSPVKRRRN